MSKIVIWRGLSIFVIINILFITIILLTLCMYELSTLKHLNDIKQDINSQADDTIKNIDSKANTTIQLLKRK
jgi:transposase